MPKPSLNHLLASEEINFRHENRSGVKKVRRIGAVGGTSTNTKSVTGPYNNSNIVYNMVIHEPTCYFVVVGVNKSLSLVLYPLFESVLPLPGCHDLLYHTCHEYHDTDTIKTVYHKYDTGIFIYNSNK